MSLLPLLPPSSVMAQPAARGWGEEARQKREDTTKAKKARKEELADAKERAQTRAVPRFYVRVFCEDETDPVKIAATTYRNPTTQIEREMKRLVGRVRTRPTDGTPRDVITSSNELHAWATGAGQLIRAVEVLWRRHPRRGHVLRDVVADGLSPRQGVDPLVPSGVPKVRAVR